MLTQELKPNNNIINTNKTMEIPFYPEIPSYSFVNTVVMPKKKFLFYSVPQTYNIYKYFSPNNLVEKYKIGFDRENIQATFLLKIYKDSIFIVDLNIDADADFNQMLKTIVQIAAERSLEVTTHKEVKINVTSSVFTDKIKRYHACGFESVENQTSFEKKFLGEALVLKVSKSSSLMKRIKKNPILQKN